MKFVENPPSPRNYRSSRYDGWLTKQEFTILAAHAGQWACVKTNVPKYDVTGFRSWLENRGLDVTIRRVDKTGTKFDIYAGFNARSRKGARS